MSGWLLDTNVIAALIHPKGAPSVKRWAATQDEDRLYLSILTIGEYEKGIAALPSDDPRGRAYASIRDGLLDRFGGRVLPVTDAVIRRWGIVTGAVKRQTGHPPPVIDTMLAATALEGGLCLVTRNLRDVAHSGALLLNPWDNSSLPDLR